MRDQPEACSLSGGVMLDRASTPIPAITARHSLFPASFTRIPIGVPCGSLCPGGREYGLTVFRVGDKLGGWVPTLPRWASCPCSGTLETRDLPTHRFGSCLSASLACSNLRGLSSVHFRSPYSQSLAPCCVMLAAWLPLAGSASPLRDRGTLSGWLRTSPLPAMPASPGYRRRNGRFCHEVRYLKQNNHLHDFTSHL